ncbi:MAG: iron-containing alcohol dehydrogenase [Erysipelotrichia bacterium]|nr:iron-containing alcohol dehydrogenase [Erysipelotrichia bacterium]
MIDFDFYSPTKIYFGSNKEKAIGQICRDGGYHKVFIVIGQGSVKRNGLLDKVIVSLNEADVQHHLLEGVRANPQIELCREGIKEALDFKPDLILAIGGGSVIDTAKNIAVGYYYDGDSFDFHLQKAIPEKALPVGVILTISAAGSELSNSCVISDDEKHIKRGFNSDLIRPVFAIENPKLTYGVSKTQTAYGIVDTMMHTLERYFNPSSDNEPADGFAEALLRAVVKAAEGILINATDYESRAVLMLMSSLSHNNLTSIGKSNILYVHQLEHAISGLYPKVAHGAGLAVLFPAWAKYYVNYDTDKFNQLATNVFNCRLKNKLDNAKAGIAQVEKLFAQLDMPKNFKDLGILNPDIERLVELVTAGGTRVIDHPNKPMDQEVVKTIFNNCL